MSKDVFYRQLLQQEEELQKALNAIKELKKYFEINTKNQAVIDFKEPTHNKVALTDGYDKDWTIKEKVHYVLKLLNEATASEVAEKLVQLDEDFSKAKANKVSTHYLSTLFRGDVIGASKVGKKNRYFIISK